MNISRIRRIKTKVPKLEYPILLEIGCGDPAHRKEGYIGLDIEDYGQEIIWDMELGIPLPDNSCSNIYASHVMEHLEDFIGVMNECWRILREDGELWVIVPHRNNEKAYLPSHVRFFDKWSFDFFQYENYAGEYHGKLWEIKELVVNDRPDIHIKMTPKK